MFSTVMAASVSFGQFDFGIVRETADFGISVTLSLCALGLSAGLISKTAAQTVTIRFSPATDNSYWVWNNGYQCWIWNGSEFEADYQGHPYSRRTGSGTSRRPQ
jgi:hypothetical protein